MKNNIINYLIFASLAFFIAIYSCSKDDSTEVTALFTVDNETGESPLTVKFKNKSTNAASYLWDFGDGTTSTDTNPVHTFNNQSLTNGVNYLVKLKATAPDSSYASVEKVISVNKLLNILNGRTTAIFNPNLEYGTLIDQDGNIYKTIKIGDRTWMAENLRTTKYNDGTPIPNVKGFEEWRTLTTGGYCTYENTTNLDSIATCGMLYNWNAVKTGKLAPKGWHVANDTDWNALYDTLGPLMEAGNKLKEAGLKHWDSPNAGANNSTGFTAVPAGVRYDHAFYDIRTYVGWWGSFRAGSLCIWMAYVGSDDGRARFDPYSERSWNSGNSVRCVKNK